MKSYCSEIDGSESISLFVAYNFKLDPWQVEKWPMDKLLKTYAFLKNKKGGN